MKIRPRIIASLLAATLVGTVYPVVADEAADLTSEIQAMDANAATRGSGVVTGKIAADFESFAGSKKNATALVTGLRNGSEITLTQEGQPSATFTPPTRPMGYGNVSTSLALAKFQLAQQGIAQPTPEQLATALNGGTITVDGKTMEYQGVLQMRADGMGWGQIAQQSGAKLGPVVSGIKARNASISAAPASDQGTTTSGSSASAAPATSTQSSAASGHSSNKGRNGIVTGAGTSTTGMSKSTGRGPVSTAVGASAPGQGIVSASGRPAGAGVQGLGHGYGQGVATAAGAGGAGSVDGGAGKGKALGHFK
jgi:antitoxin (DNA-binding transcriptional repressor) of toxin-antitoxin stability system